jgi:hypothetical protein
VEMEWNSAKKQTLWTYEELIAKLQSVLGYSFVRDHYNYTMKQAQACTWKIHR